MIGLSSTHNHSDWCDGNNTLEEMAQAAYACGFSDIGFSSHTYVDFEQFGVKDELAYIAAVRALQKQWKGKLNIAAALEHDYYFPVKNRDKLDYIVGSVHELCDKGKYYILDGDPKTAIDCKNEMFHADGIAMAKHFFDVTVENVRQYQPEIIGHFDLLKKCNTAQELFDETDEAYKTAARNALRACAKEGGVFEVNTGAIYRGYRKDPYPAFFLLEELQKINARVTINADAHETAALRFGFETTRALLKQIGFQTVVVLRDGVLIDENL